MILFPKGQMADIAWNIIADDLSLSYHRASYSSLSGNWNDHPLFVTAFQETRGASSQTFTKFELQHRQVFNTSFELTRQGVVQSLFEKVGQADIQVGKSNFDDVVLVKGWSAAEVQKLLKCPRVRSSCQSVLTHPRYAEAKITNQKITVSVAGIPLEIHECKTILQHLLRAINSLKEQGKRLEKKVAKKAPKPKKTKTAKATQAPPKAQKTKTKTKSAGSPDKFSISGICEELIDAKIDQSGANEQFDKLFKGREITWIGRLRHILPGSEEDGFEGWIATCTAGDFTVKYRIGNRRKTAFDKKPRSQISIRGKLVGFDPESKTLHIDSEDSTGKKPNTLSATIVISV